MSSDKQQHIITAVDIGTTKTRVVIAEILNNNNFKVLGYGETQNNGLKKGIVESVTKAAESLENAIDIAEKQAGVEVEYVIVGITIILGVYFLLPTTEEYYIPKPEALLKINLPDSNSTSYTIDNFTFSHSNSANVFTNDSINYSVYYPDYNAKIKFYHILSLNLEVDRFYFEKEINVHENQGAYIAEMPIENKELNIFGILYFIEGDNVATSASFFITDNFL